jgi:hypothetical protein
VLGPEAVDFGTVPIHPPTKRVIASEVPVTTVVVFEIRDRSMEMAANHHIENSDGEMKSYEGYYIFLVQGLVRRK